MNHHLRKIAPSMIITIILIRFWIETVTTTVLKNSILISNINNTAWLHHYYLGFILLVIIVILARFVTTQTKLFDMLKGLSIALIIDQYTYLASLLGIKLPFTYRSLEDYVILFAVMVCFLFWVYFVGKNTK